MGEAILKGLLGSGFLDRQDISFYEKDDTRSRYITGEYGISPAGSICSCIRGARYNLIAVKPQNIAKVVDEARGCFDKKLNCIISIIAGISTGYYERKLGRGTPVIRVMPNTPALYNRGMITISPGRSAGKKDVVFVKGLMEKIGECMVIDEGLQHISTAINGSGPAYFFLFSRSLIEAACRHGLDAETARKLVAGTITGTGEMLKRSELGIGSLISRVASPGGTTEKALETFRAGGLENIVREAVENALKRSKELEKEMT